LCLESIIRALGPVREGPESLPSLLGPVKDGGYSMAQLSDSATALGYHTLALNTTLEGVTARRGRFLGIAHMTNNHFVIVYNVTNHNVLIADPPRLYSLPEGVFNSQWSRQILLISKEPIAAVSAAWNAMGLLKSFVAILAFLSVLRLTWWAYGRRQSRPNIAIALALCVPCLGCHGSPPEASPIGGSSATARAEALVSLPAVHDLGNVGINDGGKIVDVSSDLWNQSSKTIKILDVITGCSCTSYELSDRVVKPNGRSSLRAKIKVGDSPEPRRSVITIHTDDPDNRVTTVAYLWKATPHVRTEPGSIGGLRFGLGAADRGDRPGVLQVVCSNQDICNFCKFSVASSTEHIAAKFIASPPIVKAGHDGSIDPGEVVAGRIVYDFARDMPVPIESKLHQVNSDYFILKLECKERMLATTRIPVGWSITHPITILPRKYSFGTCAPGAHIEGSFVISSADGLPFDIQSLEPKAPSVILSIVSSNGEKTRYVVHAALEAPAVPGPWGTDVLIRTSRSDVPVLTYSLSTVVMKQQSSND